MRTDRKEQRPDVMSDGKAESGVRLDDESLHFRIVSKEPGLALENRINRHKAKGYKVATEDEERVVMYCPKEDFEARQAKAREDSERLLRARDRDRDSSDEHDTFEIVKEKI